MIVKNNQKDKSAAYLAFMLLAIPILILLLSWKDRE